MVDSIARRYSIMREVKPPTDINETADVNHYQNEFGFKARSGETLTPNLILLSRIVTDKIPSSILCGLPSSMI